ncbi:unnamed protein product [Ceutorhynchus assimilis]|uniref:Sulfotransferase domain-containing protein n=1 Tax=Ceutorhynchus assimilis TaxID=467358 RepID=A0A9N9MTQ5_9CUCU|nr:unnamed protein product [Ceutorhynchus assimilis]
MSKDLFCLKAFDKHTIKNGIENDSSTEESLVQLGKYLAPPFYENSAKQILDASVRKDDVWLVSYLRTGSTWCQEIIWLIVNDLDFKTAETRIQQIRAPLIDTTNYLIKHVDFVKCPKTGLSISRYSNFVPSLEVLSKLNEDDQDKLIQLFTDSLGYVDSLSSPRTIKSHLTFELLPEQLMSVKPKIIYVIRNPKDVCVSLYYFYKTFLTMEIDFEHFCKLFMNDALIAGSIFKHYLSFWNRRHESNILILRYEDMKANTSNTIRQIAKFIGKTLSDDDIEAICKYLSFSNMQKNTACNFQIGIDVLQCEGVYNDTGNHFVRKGIVGDHKNHMAPDLVEKFDKWIEDNTRGTDLKF